MGALDTSGARAIDGPNNVEEAWNINSKFRLPDCSVRTCPPALAPFRHDLHVLQCGPLLAVSYGSPVLQETLADTNRYSRLLNMDRYDDKFRVEWAETFRTAPFRGVSSKRLSHDGQEPTRQ